MDWLQEILVAPFKDTLFTLVSLLFYALLFLILNFIMPQFKEWTRVFFFIAILTTTLKPVYQSFTMMQALSENMIAFFSALYPILMSAMAISSGAMSLMAWHPMLLLLIQFAVFLTGRWLIPLLTASLIFDFLSRFMPEISFARMADFIRVLVLSVVSATVMCYSMFLVMNSVVSVSFTGAALGPLKKMIQQNIPFIGSFITESLSTFRKYSSTTATVTSTGLMIGIFTAAIIPTLKILMSGLSFRFLAALMEPFSDKDIASFLDDIGKTLFVLCAVSFIIAFAFFFTAILAVILLKLQIQDG
ncbi:stage III sporulation protein AE [Viridibacillus sp. NPDC093762]|uniref:stage III sporulation protein AE n=1 Tax=Viridibacillus sp. NPDC093762 TaxID=3390720 RepID=UPI003D058771